MKKTKTPRQGINVVTPAMPNMPNNYQFNINKDFDLLNAAGYNWNEVKNTLNVINSETIGMGQNTINLATAPFIKANLTKEEYGDFANIMRCFSNDYTNYLNQLSKINDMQKDRHGRVDTMEDFNMYNKVSFAIQTLHEEWVSLCMPSISRLAELSTVAEDRLRTKVARLDANIQ